MEFSKPKSFEVFKRFQLGDSLFHCFDWDFSEVLESQSPQNSLQQLLGRLTGGPAVRPKRSQPEKTQTNKMEIHMFFSYNFTCTPWRLRTFSKQRFRFKDSKVENSCTHPSKQKGLADDSDVGKQSSCWVSHSVSRRDVSPWKIPSPAVGNMSRWVAGMVCVFWLVQVTWRSETMDKLNVPSFFWSVLICTPKKARKWEEDMPTHADLPI